MGLCTTKLAADVGVSRVTIFNWTRAGLLPAPERRGRNRLYSAAAVIMARSLVEAGQ